MQLNQGFSFDELVNSTDYACFTNFPASVQETFFRRVYEFWEAGYQFEKINFFSKRLNALERLDRVIQFI